MRHLVIGMGQIGSAIAQVLEGDVEMLDKKPEANFKKVDVIHICFGYTSQFVREVKRYQKKYNPTLIIIYSTVPVGTTKKIPNAVHSPVEGRHPRLLVSVKRGMRFIGYNDKRKGLLARDVWQNITPYQLIQNSDYTEFLKLASTAKYGINLVFADYVNEVCSKLGMDYGLVKDWDREYNKLYKSLSLGQFQKFVLDPPGGHIGGHCVVPNAFLLDKQFSHAMLKMIKEME